MSDDMTDATISRTEFARQHPARQRRVALDGYPKIVDDPEPETVVLKEGEISRKYFDSLSPAERRRVVADRVKVVDL